MQLYSTNHKAPNVNLEKAVFRGLPPDNGLYMPKEIPMLSDSFFSHIHEKSFPEIAFEVANALIGDEVPKEALHQIIEDAVSFDAPVIHLHDNLHVLELFHGPTLAFKDFGARFMSRLMSYFLQKQEKEINILVATSGDTGSAVAQGFLGIPNINVTILYPSGKVSEIQEKQLTTIGQNVTALEIDGVFDDCQRMVKEAFLDPELNQHKQLTSANSINIARLIPQSFYYFNAYASTRSLGKPVVFCVPSGNFGNLCGGLIAAKMGLPITHFIATTNQNHVVPDYLGGEEFTPRKSVATISNAMDVGNPSNFPRLRALYNNDDEKVRAAITGKWFDDEQTKQVICEVYDKDDYVMCPHTAVGYLGLQAFLQKDGRDVNGIVLATAHPAKFVDVVKKAIGKSIEIPERLQKVVSREKKSVKMAADFGSLKSYLMDN